MSRDGKQWTKAEEEKLTELFYSGYSYYEMSKALDRTWFACKCRLIKLKLIPFEESVTDMSLRRSIEKYAVPFTGFQEDISYEEPKYSQTVATISTYVKKNQDDTSRTFSDAELNIVMDYFKTRLAKLTLQKLDSKCFIKGIEIQTVENIFRDEISKIKMAKDMEIEQREKILFRLA